ncbi:MAG: GNAT family N-acetyltransferase [Oscillospiraceae bacterium]
MKTQQKILLRPLTMNDAPIVFELTSDQNAAKFMRFGAHHHISQTQELISQYLSPGHLAYAIVHEEDGLFAGYIALTESKEELGCYSMSIMILPRFWNCGYSTAIVYKVKELAQSSTQIRALTAHIVSENLGSCRVMDKCGFCKIDQMNFGDLAGSLYIYRYDIPVSITQQTALLPSSTINTL